MSDNRERAATAKAAIAAADALAQRLLNCDVLEGVSLEIVGMALCRVLAINVTYVAHEKGGVVDEDAVWMDLVALLTRHLKGRLPADRVN